LKHDDFMLYETNAIAAYVDDVFPGPKLTPQDPRKRARMNQWIGNLNWYFYPEMIYHVSHERLVYPELGIPGNDAIVKRAMPNVVRALEVMEKELSDNRPFLIGDAVTMADYFLLPTLFAFALTPEGKQTLPKFPLIVAWDKRMDELPSWCASTQSNHRALQSSTRVNGSITTARRHRLCPEAKGGVSISLKQDAALAIIG